MLSIFGMSELKSIKKSNVSNFHYTQERSSRGKGTGVYCGLLPSGSQFRAPVTLQLGFPIAVIFEHLPWS